MFESFHDKSREGFSGLRKQMDRYGEVRKDEGDEFKASYSDLAIVETVEPMETG